jgi:hypothetical protein
LKRVRKPFNQLLLVLATLAIGVSVSCFWNAYKLRQKEAGDDPFAIVLIDKVESRTPSGVRDEVLGLNRKELGINEPDGF